MNAFLTGILSIVVLILAGLLVVIQEPLPVGMVRAA